MHALSHLHVLLIEQQAEVLRKSTPLRVGHFYGAMGIDFWDLARWREELARNDVLVMTYQILLNALTCAFCQVQLAMPA